MPRGLLKNVRWFTHYRRPPRNRYPPGGRNHVKESPTRTRCGIRLEWWMHNETVILDAATRERAYPDCKTCRQLGASDHRRAARRAVEGALGLPTQLSVSAESSGRALSSDSRHSATGSESATIPPPVCT